MMTLSEIRSLAEEYARKYNPDTLAPFPHQGVVDDRPDLEVYFTDIEEEDVSGATLFKDDRFTIFVDTGRSETRRHFTLGHELGHYFLHQDILREEKGIMDGSNVLNGPNLRYRSEGEETRRLETEANEFAMSLLMPAHLVYRAWGATESIQKSAKIFRVSPVVMSVRLASLGLISS